MKKLKRFNESEEIIDTNDGELFELKLTKVDAFRLKKCLSTLYKNFMPDYGSLSFASQLEDKLEQFLK